MRDKKRLTPAERGAVETVYAFDDAKLGDLFREMLLDRLEMLDEITADRDAVATERDDALARIETLTEREGLWRNMTDQDKRKLESLSVWNSAYQLVAWIGIVIGGLGFVVAAFHLH